MIKYISNRGIAQLVARLSGGQEVVSSSLATPTKKYYRNQSGTKKTDKNPSFFVYKFYILKMLFNF